MGEKRNKGLGQNMVEACFGLGVIAQELWNKRASAWKGNSVVLRAVGRAEPMLLALGVELGLKGIFLLEGRSFEHIHSLSKLFKGLKSETKDRLEARFREECRKEAEFYGELGIDDIYVASEGVILKKATLENLLEKNKDMFTKDRYECEKVRNELFEPSELHRVIMTLGQVGMEMSREQKDGVSEGSPGRPRRSPRGRRK